MAAIAIGCGLCAALSPLREASTPPAVCPACSAALTGDAPRVVVWLAFAFAAGVDVRSNVQWLGTWTPPAEAAMREVLAA